jgi:antitoxin (DNA-binding transcriptional repressor) of toxin-antitoxin stability system
MKQIDLDDLPPRAAHILAALQEGEELVLAQGGGVVARLRVETAPAPVESPAELPAEDRMKEVMEHFKAMIDDEF